MQTVKSLEDIVGNGRIRENVDLFPYLSMRLHTIAQYFFEARSKGDLSQAIHATYQLNLPLILLGGGSNTVFSHSDIKGLVVRNSYNTINTVFESDTSVDIEVGSGTSMAELVQYTAEKGLSGLEYHKGLPGTVGGAIYMNSKWTHPLRYVGDCVVFVLLADRTGKEKKVERSYLAFDYDYSILQKTHEFVISVVFHLQKKDKRAVKKRASDSIEFRKKTQPIGVATGGCFFRNITDEEQKSHQFPTRSAGYLIEAAGMKGMKVGSFQVSEVHANFIINRGGDARPEDLLLLIHTIKEHVRKKFGVELEEEVQIM